MENNRAETLLMAIQDGNKLESDFWYVDIQCSDLCKSKSLCSSLNENFYCTMGFGNFLTVKVMVKGDIKIKTNNGFVEMISNVLYVHDMKSNFLSAGQLEEKGYVITIKNGTCEIYDPNKIIIATVKKK